MEIKKNLRFTFFFVPPRIFFFTGHFRQGSASLLAIFSLILFTGCQGFQRSGESGYGSGSPRKVIVVDSTGNFEAKGVPENLSLKQKIEALEKKLKPAEKEHYSKVIEWFANDQERLSYLQLNSIDEKEEWSKSNQIWLRSQSPTAQTMNLIKSQDIAVGMPRDYVKKAWGEPQNIEVSGDPLFKNERWKYLRYVSSSQGYVQERRLVYFEGGKVVGWASE